MSSFSTELLIVFLLKGLRRSCLPFIFVDREFQLHVYDNRKTSDSSWEFFKIENEQTINQLKKSLMDKKLRETTHLCVEIMNSKRNMVTWYKFAFAVWRKRDDYNLTDSANYASLFAWNLRNYSLMKNHSFVSNKYVSQTLYQTLQTTKMIFEKLLGWQVFKNHNCNPF